MAKIKTTAIVADISGKIAGSVFYRTKNGLICRTKVTPPNPQSPRQSFIRGNMSAISPAWSALSKGLRTAWENFSSQHPVPDQFGDLRVLSGIAMFNKVNGVLLNVGEAIKTTPPANTDIDEITGLDLEVSGGVGTNVALTFLPDPVAANRAVILKMTDVIGPARDFVKNLLKQVTYVAAAGTAPSGFALPSNFGEFQVGDRCAYQYVHVNTQNGMTWESEVMFTEAV